MGPPPIVTRISPKEGPLGTRVIVRGEFLGNKAQDLIGKETFTPLKNAENSAHKQSGHSRNPGKENPKTIVNSRKRRSVINKNDIVSKRLRMDVNNEDSKCPSDLQDESKQDLSDELYKTNQYRNHFPHQLIGFMYRLNLSVLCSLRRFTYEHKYPLLSLAFEDSEIDKFNNIVLRYKKKSIHIQIENVDKHYIDNDISYARLFAKEKQSFSINNYFDSFVKYLISKLDSLPNNIEYLIIYTNSGLDLTEEKKLKQARYRNFYPFKFDSINIEECDILKDFLFTNDNTQGRGFYQFSQDKTTREELLKRLEFSSAVQKVIKERKLSQKFEKEIKEEFLDKLVFAVNQPNREELNSIIKNEIEKNSKAQYDYTTLEKEILDDLTAPDKHKGKLVSGIIYEFNVLMFFLHDVFLHKNMFSINSERKSDDISNDITVHYKDKITYIKAHTTDSNIGYSQLFSSRKRKEKNTFNKHFTLFIEELKKDIKYFIIYTNADLDLTEEKKLKQGLSKDFYPLKFHSIDIRKKKYKILRDCSCINENGLYKFAQEETTRKKLLSLLNLPPSLQKEKEKGRLSNEHEKETKEKFLDKLIFAINQPNKEKLNSIIKNEIKKYNESNEVPYNYEELHEIALRWSESHEFGPITKRIIKKLFKDIKNNRSSYQKIQYKDLEKIKFAKSVVGREGTPAFYQFLDFLVKGEGIKYLEVLKEKGINLPNMSSILNRAGANAAKPFTDLYNLWFDAKGNKTQYLETLEKEGINLPNISSILNGAGTNAAKAFKDLYDLWFDAKGNKTQYLKTLEKEGINLPNMSSILSGAGVKSPKAFKDLYDLWFDAKGNKTQYLKTLEKEGINLPTMSSILSRAAANAAKAFKDLYDLWFDAEGKKTQYLKILEEEGMNLTNISSILHGAASNAAKAFKDLYGLWFDEQGNTKQHLKHFIKKKDGKKSFTLRNLSSMLNGAGANAKDAFEKLHSVCFNDEGKRTELLDDFYKADFRPRHLSCMLCGAGVHTYSTLKKLHSVCFNDEGKRTKLLDDFCKAGFRPSDLCNTLSAAADSLKKFYDFCFIGETKKYLNHFLNEKEGFTPSNLSEILHGARANICSVLKDFHDVCFDETGNKTQLLDDLYKVGFRPSDLSNILSMAGNNATSYLKNFHKLCFNKDNYLNHFLTEKEIFTPKILSRVLHRVGINICPVFEKLHNLCFDKVGNKTSYLKNLIESNQSNVSDILREEVFRKSFIFLNKQDISEIQEDKTTNADLKSSNLSARTKQKQNLDSLQVAGSSCSSRDLSSKQIQSVQYNKKQQEVSLHLSKFVSSIEPVKQGLYLPSFEKRGIKVDGKCVAITRSLSQALFLLGDKSFLSNLENSPEVYERIAQGKQISKRKKREVFSFSELLDSFEQQLDSPMNNLPSSLIHTEGYKTLDDLSHYIAGIEDDFAVYLVTSDHVIAIYRISNGYAYFDSNAAFVSGLKSVDQLMEVLQKAVKFAGYKVEENGFLIERFDVDRADSQLSDKDKQVQTREIKTERQLLAEHDTKFGPVEINGQGLSRVHLYDFGTKVHIEGSVLLLINADMKLDSTKFQEHLDKK